MRVRSIRNAIAVAALAAAWAVSADRAPLASAHIVPGEFSLYAYAPLPEVGVGSSFEVHLGIEHDGSVPYQAVQWHLDYDESRASVAWQPRPSWTPSAPCGPFSNYNGRVLAACTDASGSNMTYAGTALVVTFRCDAPGTAALPLTYVGGESAGTNVLLAYNGNGEWAWAQVHAHGDSVVCSPDIDLDGLPDGYEQSHACLDWQTPGAGLDPDADGLASLDEFKGGTDPCSDDTDLDTLGDGGEVRNGTAPAIANPDPADPDDDDDGCTDAAELGAAAVLGGARDPLYKWDFFDTTGDKAIDLSDTLDILGYFGDAGAANTPGDLRDRDSFGSPQPWQTYESNDGVDLTDALVNLQSFGHDCG